MRFCVKERGRCGRQKERRNSNKPKKRLVVDETIGLNSAWPYVAEEEVLFTTWGGGKSTSTVPVRQVGVKQIKFIDFLHY